MCWGSSGSLVSVKETLNTNSSGDDGRNFSGTGGGESGLVGGGILGIGGGKEKLL